MDWRSLVVLCDHLKMDSFKILFSICLWTLSATTWAQNPKCISKAELEKRLKEVQAATVKLTYSYQGQSAQGSGFFVQSDKGTELVTAHHVASTSDAGCSSAGWDPESLKLAQVGVHFSNKTKSNVRAKFNVRPGDYDWGNDLIKTSFNASGRPSLSVQSKDHPPTIEDEIIILGYPSAKNGKYMRHHCKMRGYSSSNDNDSPVYALKCRDINYIIGGMSGGPAISACTGKVLGAVSSQSYDDEKDPKKRCVHNGDPNVVFVSPVFQDSSQKVLFGVQQTIFDTKCVYAKDDQDGAYSQSRKCNVTPGMFSEEPPGKVPASKRVH